MQNYTHILERRRNLLIDFYHLRPREDSTRELEPRAGKNTRQMKMLEGYQQPKDFDVYHD